MKTPHWARHSASAAHQRKWTAKWRGISGCTSRKICGSNTPWRRRRQRWTPRRRPHVSGPAGEQVRPQRKRNCRVDNKPIRTGTEAPADQENPPLLPACRLSGGYRTWGYLGAVDRDSEDRILWPATVYLPKNRTVAMPSKVTGTHISPSCANCRVI